MPGLGSGCVIDVRAIGVPLARIPRCSEPPPQEIRNRSAERHCLPKRWTLHALDQSRRWRAPRRRDIRVCGSYVYSANHPQSIKTPLHCHGSDEATPVCGARMHHKS